MDGNIIIAIFSVIYMTIILIKYITGKKINTYETKIYNYILICSYLQNIIGIILFFVLSLELKVITNIVHILYLISMTLWLFFFSLYIIRISEKNDNVFEKTKKILFILEIISIVLVTFLPSEFVTNENKNVMYSTGASINVVYSISLIYIFIYSIFVVKNFKNIKDKRYIPLLLFTIVGLLAMYLTNINPEYFLITPLECFIVFVMYFTIENPDVKMLNEVSLAKETAEKANHAKSEFLSNMSHEIRTPLNAIVGFSESLKDDDIPQESKEKVNDIIMASNNLLDLVNGILDISKIEANKLEIINKEYEIQNIIDELIALTKARIGDKGLDFRVKIDPSIPKVLYGDDTRLKQIILNILTNAVKYTKEGYVEFTISSVIKDNVCRLIISVEDSGIGIKEEALPKLFSKFERLNVEKQLTIEGTGLGLAITKRLIELMNGKVVVQSVYGKGSKFTISIDQRIVAMEAPQIKEVKVTESKVINANGARILLVDDNDLNIKVASTLLRKYNFNIDSVNSGFACIDKIEKGEKYDIIFLDDMMPKMSGRETIQKLKSIEGYNIPTIALTANAISGMKEEYLSCGFDDYLSKPIEKLELERVIKTYLHKITSNQINTESSNNSSSIISNMDFELPKINEVKKEDNQNQPTKKVLLVDDNEINIKVALMSLKKYNLDVTSVTSGSEAISKVIENKYDLILLDDMMPELDGCKTLENLKSLEDFNTPTYMMTASKEDEVIDKIKKYGFDGYLGKPFSKETLDKIIKDILNK